MNFLQMLCCALAMKSGELIDGYNSVLGARQLRGRRVQTFEETNAFLQSVASEIADTGKNICMCPAATPTPVAESGVVDERRLRSWNQRSGRRELVK